MIKQLTSSEASLVCNTQNKQEPDGHLVLSTKLEGRQGVPIPTVMYLASVEIVCLAPAKVPLLKYNPAADSASK